MPQPASITAPPDARDGVGGGGDRLGLEAGALGRRDALGADWVGFALLGLLEGRAWSRARLRPRSAAPQQTRDDDHCAVRAEQLPGDRDRALGVLGPVAGKRHRRRHHRPLPLEASPRPVAPPSGVVTPATAAVPSYTEDRALRRAGTATDARLSP